MKCNKLIYILNMLEDKDREICIFFDDNIYAIDFIDDSMCDRIDINITEQGKQNETNGI